ncbi:MAG: glycerol-3-phosphate responsive antiterminator, partial [Pseudobutyrivibrio sp.]|nr:glycerol-3-phosphate responsive antiterminator [Pseudobutyrivibrio sp.]
MNFKEILFASPVIAAVNTEEDIEKALTSECKVVFIIHSTLQNVKELVGLIKEADRIAIVHADLVAGLSSKEVAIEFLLEQTLADGIVSTKPQLIKKAIDMGRIGILRAFMIDTAAMETCKKQMELIKPDAVELMPGIVPRVFADMRAYSDMALIAGGLIRDKDDVIQAFDAGIDAVSA